MVHLIVHLVQEIRTYGPVYLIWMYPFERYMKIVEGYVKHILLKDTLQEKQLSFVHIICQM